MPPLLTLQHSHTFFALSWISGHLLVDSANSYVTVLLRGWFDALAACVQLVSARGEELRESIMRIKKKTAHVLQHLVLEVQGPCMHLCVFFLFVRVWTWSECTCHGRQKRCRPAYALCKPNCLALSLQEKMFCSTDATSRDFTVYRVS